MGTQILTRLMNYFELFATKQEYIKKNPEKITPKPNEDTEDHKYFQLNESYQIMVRTPFFYPYLVRFYSTCYKRNIKLSGGWFP